METKNIAAGKFVLRFETRIDSAGGEILHPVFAPSVYERTPGDGFDQIINGHSKRMRYVIGKKLR